MWYFKGDAPFSSKSWWAISCTCASILSTLGEVFEPHIGADVLVAHGPGTSDKSRTLLPFPPLKLTTLWTTDVSLERFLGSHTEHLKACIMSLSHGKAAVYLLTVPKLCSRCSQDETCQVYPLLGHYGRFQFNAFKFLRHLSSVYLKCKILICDTSDETSRCNQGCVSRRKRDVSSYKWKTDSVIGPIRLKRDRSASGNSGKNTLFMI